MAENIYQGATGLEIVVDCGRDLSGAGRTDLVVRTPSGAVKQWEAAVTTVNGLASGLSYVTKAGDLAEAGTYRLQAAINLDGWTGRSRTVCLRVRPLFA